MQENSHKVKSTYRTLMSNLLVGDVGGTKTLVALYDAIADPPVAGETRRFETTDFTSVTAIIDLFLDSSDTIGSRPAIDGACFGVAGPVRGRVAQLTNVPWQVDAEELASRYSIPQVRLLNDVEALGYGVTHLADAQLETLQVGDRGSGNAAIIAPGTGLGEALLHRTERGLVPVASEAGHTDFAARSRREYALAEFIIAERGRASYEDVLTGPGLINIHRFTHDAEPCPNVSRDAAPADMPSAIASSGLGGTCSACEETLGLFVSALGAETGNLALRSMATAGIFLGGGIPAKILPALRSPSFLQAFAAKPPMGHLLDAMPVAVVLEEHASLIGAAVAARQEPADAAWR